MSELPNKKKLEEAANKYANDSGDDCLCQRTQPGTPVGEHIYCFCGCEIFQSFKDGAHYQHPISYSQGIKDVIDYIYYLGTIRGSITEWNIKEKFSAQLKILETLNDEQRSGDE